MQTRILVTGANRGIGLEFVRQYADTGAQVYACCREPAQAAELSKMADASAGAVSVHRLDVTDADHRASLVEELGDTSIDMLINNAGIYGQRNSVFGQTDEARWLETFAVNVIAPMQLCEALVENVTSSRRKVIASISSQMGSIEDNGSGGHYVYRSSKAALNAVMKSMAVDLGGRGITAVILHPGWVKTDMGGSNALISAVESVNGMRATLDGLTARDAGKFLGFDGSLITW
ncbi:MAG: SDR family oxidoreductase [Gammaproteobacteria bacterium]|nr:SDR family oxidoreductase [Gammaproteobacteria bacterium]